MNTSFSIFRADRYLHDRSSFSGPVPSHFHVYGFKPIPRREDVVAGMNLLASETIPQGDEPAFRIAAPQGAKLVEMTDGSIALEAMGPLGLYHFTAAEALKCARDRLHGFQLLDDSN